MTRVSPGMGFFWLALILLPRCVDKRDHSALQRPGRPSNTGHLRPVLALPGTSTPSPRTSTVFRSPKHHTLAVWLVHQRSYGRLIGAGRGQFGGTHPISQSIRYL